MVSGHEMFPFDDSINKPLIQTIHEFNLYIIFII